MDAVKPTLCKTWKCKIGHEWNFGNKLFLVLFISSDFYEKNVVRITEYSLVFYLIFYLFCWQITGVFNTSSINTTFLGALVESFTDTNTGAEVTVRLDFLASTMVTNDEIRQAFLDGLNANMFLGSDSQVVSVNVSLAGRYCLVKQTKIPEWLKHFVTQ